MYARPSTRDDMKANIAMNNSRGYKNSESVENYAVNLSDDSVETELSHSYRNDYEHHCNNASGYQRRNGYAVEIACRAYIYRIEYEAYKRKYESA